jgi:GGDEF domain-containing protein
LTPRKAVQQFTDPSARPTRCRPPRCRTARRARRRPPRRRRRTRAGAAAAGRGIASVTASLDAGEFPDDGEGSAALIDAADRRMDAVKEGGGNAVGALRSRAVSALLE